MSDYRIVFDPFNGNDSISINVTIEDDNDSDVDGTFKRWAKAVNESHIVANMKVYKTVEKDITP